MKYLLYCLLLLPFLADGQSATSVTYTKTLRFKGQSAETINKGSLAFVKDNKALFFSLLSYSKDSLEKNIDTSGYGFYTANADTVMAHCTWVYLSSKTNCDVLKGEIVFIAGTGKAIIELKNLQYFTYTRKNGAFVFVKQGLYNDLGICKHCSTAGIIIGQMANDNFLKIGNEYKRYQLANNNLKIQII